MIGHLCLYDVQNVALLCTDVRTAMKMTVLKLVMHLLWVHLLNAVMMKIINTKRRCIVYQWKKKII